MTNEEESFRRGWNAALQFLIDDCDQLDPQEMYVISRAEEFFDE